MLATVSKQNLSRGSVMPLLLAWVEGAEGCRVIVPLTSIEYGLGYVITRSPHTTYSIYLRGTVVCRL